MTTERFVPDEKTLRDLAVLNHLLSKPTGNAEKDARNAAQVQRYRSAISEGQIIYLSALPDCDIVQQARSELAQAARLV